MPVWRDCKLGDLLEIKHGYAFLGKHFVNAGSHIVLTPGSFYDEGGFKDKAEKEKWYNGPIPTDYVLDSGDIIVAMTEQAEGLLGSSAIIPRSGVYLHNQRLGLVQLRDESKTDKRFVYYLFNTKSVRQQIRASASGVKIRHTAPTRIAEVKVSVPPLPAQRRISTILSAYDDLIENNARRIKILGEMAQTIYREWFVNFRFPDHEKVRMVESELGQIPQGWSVRRLGEVLSLEYGKALKAGQRSGGVIPVFGSSGVVGYHSERLARGPGIVVGRKGNVGSVFFCDCDFWVIDTAYYVSTSLPLYFVYFNLLTQNFLNNDVAVPGLNRNQAHSLPAIIPDANTLQTFESHVEYMFKLKTSLEKINSNLRTTRDLLLPKLVSGEITVEQIKSEVAAQTV
jgi:type I restriction enzyme, S subunit